MSVIETIEHSSERVGGKEYPITITRRRGLHSFKTDEGEEILVDAVTITDACKYGKSYCISPHQDFSEEARCKGRNKLLQCAAAIIRDQNGNKKSRV